MPSCKTCSSFLLLDNDLKEYCPECIGKILLNKDKSICFCNRVLEKLDVVKHDFIKKYSKWHLIQSTLNARAFISTDIVNKAPRINLSRLIAIDYLLRDLLKTKDFGTTNITGEALETLIYFYENFYCRIVDNIEYIENDFGFIVLDDDIDISLLIDRVKRPDNNFNNFFKNLVKSRFHFKVEWKQIYEMFKLNLVFSQKDGEEYLRKHAEEYKRIGEESKLGKSVSHRELTIPDYISKFLPTIVQLGCLLRMNRATEELYSFRELDGRISDPRILMDVADIGMRKGLAIGLSAQIPKNKFIKHFSRINSNPEQTLDALIFNEESKSTPLVIKRGGKILISPMHSTLLTLYLFHLLCPEQVNEQKNRAAGEFEKEIVPKILKDYGFDLRDPKHNGKELIDRVYTKAGKQFDVIGVKNDVLFVFECKKWGLTPKYFFKYRSENRKTEIEGIYEDQVIRINFLKDNMGDLGFDDKKIKQIRNILVLETLGNTPLTLYKDMQIIDLDGISKL